MIFCNYVNQEHMDFGLQLYTLRDVIMDNPEEIIRKVAGSGYSHIESFEGPSGMYWGMGSTGFRTFLDELGVAMVSSHADVFRDFEKKADEAAEIGVRYLVCPWILDRIGDPADLDAFRRMADEFNRLGRIAKKAGIGFAYHNHAYSFRQIDGEIPQKVLMDNTDPVLVSFQMDIYWVVAAGQDPVEWITAYPDRFTSSHVKDGQFRDDGYAGGEREGVDAGRPGGKRVDVNAGGAGDHGVDMESVVLGTGIIDYPRILRLAKEKGMKYFIVEQEAYTGTTPMDAVKANAAYMKGLRMQKE